MRAVDAVDAFRERLDRGRETAVLERERTQRKQDVAQSLLLVHEACAQIDEIDERAVDIRLGAARDELDADRGVRERLCHAVVELAREAVTLLLDDLDDAQALGGELLRELHVFERHAGRPRERLDETLVVLLEGALAVVDGLQHSEPAPVARVDRRDEHRTGPEATAGIDARVEARVLVRRVDPQQSARAGHLRREAATVERQADLGELAFLQDARPQLVLALIDDVEGRALAVEHRLRGVDDAVEHAVDVRLQRELPLQLQQRLELRGVVQIGHAG